MNPKFWLFIVAFAFGMQADATESITHDEQKQQTDNPSDYADPTQTSSATAQRPSGLARNTKQAVSGPRLRETPSRIKIDINKKYFEICEAELGPFPQSSIDCDDAVLIPTQRTNSDKTVLDLTHDKTPSIPRFRPDARAIEQGVSPDAWQVKVNEKTQLVENITTCDKPSGIYRDMKNVGCVAGNRIKHIANAIRGGEIVDWVYICRRNNKFLREPHYYNELGLIGYNRNTGKTCYFAGEPTMNFYVEGNWDLTYPGKVEKKDLAEISIIHGQKLPPPSSGNEKSVNHWSLPAGAGGCTGCHSNGPFVRFPFNEPVCAVQGSAEKCLKSFSDLGDCTNYVKKKYSSREQILYQCKVLKPKRQPGMLYSVVSPFDKDGSLYKYIQSLEGRIDADKDNYYKSIHTEAWNVPKHLTAPEAQPCTLCHAIGNDRYASLFVNSLFSIHRIDPVTQKFQPDKDAQLRSKLFFSNVSETRRSKSDHDKKLEKQGILPIKVDTSNSENANVMQKTLSMERYIQAIRAINDYAKMPDGSQWDEHWTVERVKKEPLKYLQENCSYCHTANMAEPVLLTDDDFKNPENAKRIISRMNEPNSPMPPSGHLPSSVKGILADYLRKN